MAIETIGVIGEPPNTPNAIDKSVSQAQRSDSSQFSNSGRPTQDAVDPVSGQQIHRTIKLDHTEDGKLIIDIIDSNTDKLIRRIPYTELSALEFGMLFNQWI